MNIYIDESGSFIPLGGNKSKFSAVGALVIPHSIEQELFAQIREVKDDLGLDAHEELKGSKLLPHEFKALVAVISKYDVIFDACLIDTGSHTEEEVAVHRQKQSAEISASFPDEVRTPFAEKFRDAGRRLASLPPQLYVQAFLTWVLLDHVARTAVSYYAQQLPTELGQFRWIIDPKDPHRRMPIEELWGALLLPIFQTKSLTEPFPRLPSGDYSHFDRVTLSSTSIPRGLRRQLRPGTKQRVHNSAKIFEDRSFPRSDQSLGLQLADILTNGIARAYDDTLKPSMWINLGSLMVRDAEGAGLTISLTKAAAQRWRGTEQARFHGGVAEILGQRSKPLIQNSPRRGFGTRFL